jgi:penicillin-binding protein 1C
MIRFLAFSSLTLSGLLLCFWFWIHTPLDPKLFLQEYGQVFTDKHGEILFFNTSKDDKYILPPTDFSEISLPFIKAVLVLEDDNFFAHGAVDTPAIFRAAFQNMASGEIVSGASTISQQLAKKILKHKKRTLKNKGEETLLALRIEAQFSKEEIFSLWANHAPFGGNIVGISAASEYYFHKSPKDLSLAQSAYLAGIPQNPQQFSPLSPHKNNKIVQKKIQKTLNKMIKKEFIDAREAKRAQQEILAPFQKPPTILAPHLVLYLQQFFPKTHFIQLSIDIGIQSRIERIVEKHLHFLQNHHIKNAAVIVIENKTGAVRAYLGNRNYFEEKNSGKVDILRSFRQSGSTLKPFVYYLTFQNFGWTSETKILDEPISFESSFGTPFAPKNFDLNYRGEITVREALAESRNIPAVSALSKIGEKKFQEFLSALDVTFLQQENDAGLGTALGASEMKPLDIAKLYTLLAREGETFFLCFIGICPEQRGEQILKRQLVLELTDILSDNNARTASFGTNSPLSFLYPVAAKTGTTRNFRDNYTVGFTTEYTVLVWVGNADGSPMKDVSGITGAGFIFHDILDILSDISPPQEFPLPDTREDTSNSSIQEFRILSPLQGQRYSMDPSRPPKYQKILFETTKEGEFFIDGKKIGSGKKIFWTPIIGSHSLSVKKGNEVLHRQFSVHGQR